MNKDKLRLLIVINSLAIGGAENLVTELALLLQSSFVKIDLLVFNKVDSHLEKKLLDKGVIVHFSTKYNLYNPLNVFIIKRFICNYDIIHVHLFPMLYWVSLAKLISSNKYNIIYTEHSTSNRRRKFAILRLLDKFVYKQYNSIICISKSVQDELCKVIGTDSKTSVINNGINVKAYSECTNKLIKSKINVPVNSILLCQISSFRAAKDQDTVIKTLKLLPDNVYLILVGDGPRKKNIYQLVENLGLLNRVVFTGVRSDIKEILAASDIIIQSSHWEGFGIAAVEGMASGKPVIGSDVKGLSEVIGNSNLLFPVGDSARLKYIILKMIDNKEFYDSMSRYCLERSKEYDIHSTFEKYSQIYKNIYNEK